MTAEPKFICEPHEVVPDGLRERLHWDSRHDAMARLVVDEFNLTLPRDRELVRQLAFIRVQQGAAHVIPFGKYKGRLVEEIFVDDSSYLDWLAGQDWFRTEFAVLHQVIIDLDAQEAAA
jgi:uncharacterized protein (DUF3820 family)